MKTVLFAWELGEGLGHVGRLRCVARELSAQGHRAIFAVREVGSRTLVADDGYPVLQAPVWLRPVPRERLGTASYADLLATHGFADADDRRGQPAADADRHRAEGNRDDRMTASGRARRTARTGLASKPTRRNGSAISS